jgi:hypothetical protein
VAEAYAAFRSPQRDKIGAYLPSVLALARRKSPHLEFRARPQRPAGLTAATATSFSASAPTASTELGISASSSSVIPAKATLHNIP